MTVDCCQIWCKYVKENRWISVLSNITNTRFHSFPSKPTVSGISSPSKWRCWCSYHEIPDDVASYFPLRSFSFKPPYPAFEETGQDTLSLFLFLFYYSRMPYIDNAQKYYTYISRPDTLTYAQPPIHLTGRITLRCRIADMNRLCYIEDKDKDGRIHKTFYSWLVGIYKCYIVTPPTSLSLLLVIRKRSHRYCSAWTSCGRGTAREWPWPERWWWRFS